VFAFVPITLNNDYGNLIDNITFASGSPVAQSPAIEYDNDVSLSAATKAGYIYGLAEVRGSSVSVIANAQVVNDPDGAGASPETPLAIDYGQGNGGWYSSTLFDAGDVITFKGLTADATYQYRINTPANWTWSSFTATGSGESPSFTFSATDDTCYVRLAVTATLPASFTAALTTAPLVIEPVYFSNYAYGGDSHDPQQRQRPHYLYVLDARRNGLHTPG
jgi:hypothetical protein